MQTQIIKADMTPYHAHPSYISFALPVAPHRAGATPGADWMRRFREIAAQLRLASLDIRHPLIVALYQSGATAEAAAGALSMYQSFWSACNLDRELLYDVHPPTPQPREGGPIIVAKTHKAA